MTEAPIPATRRVPRTPDLPGYVWHPSFADRAAARRHDPAALLADPVDYAASYMPDDATRDHARRMHHAAHRVRKARTAAERDRWRHDYLALRDRIVLGNRKLIFRAVRRRSTAAHQPDDLIGDCQIVLIQAVAVFNPWMTIRFSTYAYTCLIRALARSARRLTTDWLARSLTFDVFPGGEPSDAYDPEPATASQARVDEFLRADHPLLTEREKAVIAKRFSFKEEAPDQTLEMVGRAVGLSKERVRQVQAIAIGKLRAAMLPAAAASPGGSA